MSPLMPSTRSVMPDAAKVYRDTGRSWKSYLPKLGKKRTFERRHRRYRCCIIGSMDIVERAYSLDATVLEISQGGLLMRVASTYVLDRNGALITAHFDGLSLRGKIMSSRAEGYGIKLLDELDLTMVGTLVEDFGFEELQGTVGG